MDPFTRHHAYLEAVAAQAKGLHSAAASLFEAAISDCLATSPGSCGTFAYAKALSHLAYSCSQQCKFAEALQHANQSLQVINAVLETTGCRERSLHRGLNYEVIGNVFSEQGKTTESIAATTSALHHFESAGNNDGAFRSLANLAGQFSSTRQYAQGLAFIERAKRIRRTIPTDPGLYVIEAELLGYLGRTDEAFVVLTGVLAREESAGRHNSVPAVRALIYIGHSHLNARRFPEAKLYYHRAIVILEQVDRRDTPIYAEALQSLGVAHLGMRQLDLALEYYNRCLALRRRILNSDHPDIAETLTGISMANTLMHRHEEAAAARALSDGIERRSQTHCSGPSCTRLVREDGAPLDVCVKCRRTFYCGKGCQTADWKREGGHKAECKALIAEGKAT